MTATQRRADDGTPRPAAPHVTDRAPNEPLPSSTVALEDLLARCYLRPVYQGIFDLTSGERSLRGRMPGLERVVGRFARGLRPALGAFCGRLPRIALSHLRGLLALRKELARAGGRSGEVSLRPAARPR